MVLLFVRALILSRAKLLLEPLVLRQLLGDSRRAVHRPQIQNQDRLFWVVVSRIWKEWQWALVIS
jgi:hypothetical protein